MKVAGISFGLGDGTTNICPNLGLAGYPQLLAAPSGGHPANVSVDTLITQGVGSVGGKHSRARPENGG
jgi:hypothetical protein